MKKTLLKKLSGLLFLVLIAALFPLGSAGAKDQVITIKMANFFPPPSKQSLICEEFIKDLEMRTKGRIKVQYFAGGSLLKGPTAYKGIEQGIADIGYSQIWYTPGRMPVTEACGLPMGCPSAWVGSHITNDFYFQFKPKEWEKVKVLWFNTAAPNNVLSKKPIRSLEELKGVSLRAPGLMGEVVEALGGTAAPTPMAEVYDAIAKGVIDGVYSVYEVLKTWRFAEVVRYMTVSWQVGNCVPFYMAMNKKSYGKLPPDIKEIFDDLCGEYRMRCALMWNEIELAGKSFGTEKGVEYIELSDQEATKWKKAAQPVINNYIKRMVDKGYPESEVKGWISFLKERIEFYTKKQIEYRIPSPTGPAAMRPENIGK